MKKPPALVIHWYFYVFVTCMCVFTESIRWNNSETPTVQPRLPPRVPAFAENLSDKEKNHIQEFLHAVESTHFLPVFVA
jgi:hypothetical protein